MSVITKRASRSPHRRHQVEAPDTRIIVREPVKLPEPAWVELAWIAAFARMSKNTVRRRAMEGVFGEARKIGGCLRWSRAAVEAAFEGATFQLPGATATGTAGAAGR